MPFGISPTFDRVVYPARGRPDRTRVAEDVQRGLVSRETARDLYGVTLTAAFEVDEPETARLRAAVAAE